ncbi:hypothetical protein [Streptomyces sp. NPDC047043]|uniref:hypothetical protein n=1 Tax=Streptomyces sp. NPDC047043 TaxID=3154497 RepID=UPI0033E9517A
MVALVCSALATWRFAGGRTGEGFVDAGAEPTRKGSTVFAGDDWGYRSRGALLGSVLPKAGVLVLVLGALAVLSAIPRLGRRHGYTLPRTLSANSWACAGCCTRRTRRRRRAGR